MGADERDYLDPFQSGFKLGYGTEMAVATLVNEEDKVMNPILTLLDFFAAFNAIIHGILLDWLQDLELGSQCCTGSVSFTAASSSLCDIG